MVRKGKNFELLIKKVETLKNKGAEIKSPEYVIDVDTGTKREVDIGIHFNNTFIAIECRDRSGIQDIQWIEQLITKKNSINANVLIAVTSSSFTEPAKQKAFKHGILLRHVENISAEDILTLKEASYIEVCYISNFLYNLEYVLFKNKPFLSFEDLQNSFIYTLGTENKIPFNDFLNNVAINSIQKIENLDKQNIINKKFEVKFSNLLLWPFDYEIQGLCINIALKVEKIKYPLVSIKKYKNSHTYDLLGQIQEYGICNNNFIIDTPSNASSWQIDFKQLEIQNKILISFTVYNETPTKLQNVTIIN